MGSIYFATKKERKAYEATLKTEDERIADCRKRIAAKIVMIIVDKLITEIVRPGPVAEERECYEMAGEIRASVSSLEDIVVEILNVNDGVI